MTLNQTTTTMGAMTWNSIYTHMWVTVEKLCLHDTKESNHQRGAFRQSVKKTSTLRHLM